MNREREKLLSNLFRHYKENKKELVEDYNIPTPSAVAYDKIKVKGDTSRNVPYEMTVEYASKREELSKKVYIVEEVINWFKLEGHGRDRFITVLLIDGNSWIKTERVCSIAESTLSLWRRDVLEKAEMVAKWVNFF
jgi:hypothetical protein